MKSMGFTDEILLSQIVTNLLKNKTSTAEKAKEKNSLLLMMKKEFRIWKGPRLFTDIKSSTKQFAELFVILELAVLVEQTVWTVQ